MKIIKYQMLQGEILCNVEIDYNEANLDIAKKESYNGEYVIEDDEQSEII